MSSGQSVQHVAHFRSQFAETEWLRNELDPYVQAAEVKDGVARVPGRDKYLLSGAQLTRLRGYLSSRHASRQDHIRK